MLDLSEPVFSLGGAVLGVMASHPMVPTVFMSHAHSAGPLRLAQVRQRTPAYNLRLAARQEL